jgi:hypothetical protein
MPMRALVGNRSKSSCGTPSTHTLRYISANARLSLRSIHTSEKSKS